ncbi:MAG: tryptophan--tRNA ligase [Elusimicrobiales bacterium]|nr:tryptophan--tRNA ligase [Elusimicrobiales bacterium]
MAVVLSGMRPTGRIHLGNYWGALYNFIKLQDSYECYFFVADLHSLTTYHNYQTKLYENTFMMVVDWLAAGIDPKKCVIFKQSDIYEHSQLHLILSMVTPISWLLRNPTFKEQLLELYERRYRGQEEKAKKANGSTRKIAEISGIDEETQNVLLSEIANYGFLGYPVLQSADILLYDADYVPVGKDQLAHIEITRHIAARFNSIFKTKIFKEPEPLLTSTPILPGLDAKKMSKSYSNTIELGEHDDQLYKKIMKMYTDPKKIKINDLGNPDGCVVFAFHKVYNDEYMKVELDCRNGKIGCVACKKNLFEILNPWMKNIDEKRKKYIDNHRLIKEIIEQGNEKARSKASKKLREVMKIMGLI